MRGAVRGDVEYPATAARAASLLNLVLSSRQLFVFITVRIAHAKQLAWKLRLEEVMGAKREVEERKLKAMCNNHRWVNCLPGVETVRCCVSKRQMKYDARKAKGIEAGE